MDLYSDVSGKFQICLEILAIVFLMFSTLFEINILIHSFCSYHLLSYIAQSRKWFFWVHTSLMWYGFSLWIDYYRRGSNFSLNLGYPILRDPQAPARYFETDVDWELKYLQFMDQIKDTVAVSENYRCIAGLSSFLFIFSLLEAFRFQPRLGLLTRTLDIVAPDLVNYCILFFTIFGGFASAATLLFGHQVYKVSTIEKSIVFLVFLVRLLDPTQFWHQVFSL